jgi:metallo-beta-lactamase family protein
MTEYVACTERHALPDGEVRLLGAVRQVTGAATRVEIGSARILVDCGVAQGRERQPMNDAVMDADALVLTHGHLDHIGNVPTILEKGWDKTIYATNATLEIARISLEDSLHMQRASQRTIEQFLARFEELTHSVAYGQTIDVAGVSLTLHEAGHILGSSSAEIESAASRVIVSGDLGRPASPILRDFNTSWRAGKPVDVVVMESTYGDRDHAHTHDDIERTLEAILKDVVARKSKVLVPAFAIGRTQTLLWFLNNLVEQRRIPEVPVFIDTPMGATITETYQQWKRLFDKESLAMLARGDDPLDFHDLFLVEKGRDSQRLQQMDGPMIIIAGSGMCTGGRILGHLREGLPDADTTVLFVGYQGQGTPGRRIQDAAEQGGRVDIDGQSVLVRAKIATLRGLSAHADRKELLGWVGHIPDVRRVALHHGEPEAQRAFAGWAGARAS